MTIAPGATLGHYSLVTLLGAGGMGEVWLADDEALKRKVALKILPSAVVADPERLARFRREAESLAALSHPGIVTIYSIEHDPAANLHFLTMEFVEGQDLSRLVRPGGMPIAQVLDIGIQLADALAASHEQGIVHRDLKPANVMVAVRERRVKVLDFGLAKQAALPHDGETRTALSTGEGTILGTVAYMSPEQAEGRPLDARSDIFSLGVVLYELATGERPFKGDTNVSVLSSILRETPRSATELRADLPRDLVRVIRRCLQKDREQRFQTAKDVRNELQLLKADLDSGELPPTTPAPGTGRGSSRRRPGRVSAIVGVAIVVLAAAALVVRWSGRRPTSGEHAVLTQLTTDTGLTVDPALSRDGRLVAFASDRAGRGDLDLWVRQVAGGEPIRLTDDPANDREPSFSPDGTMIVFRSDRDGGGIYVVSALGGGPARKVAAEGQRPRFSPDGSLIAYWSGLMGAGAELSIRGFCRIFVVPASGGDVRQLRADFVGAAYPEWTPDGRHVLFLGNRDEKLSAEQGIDWWVTPLDGGSPVATGAFAATRAENLTGPLLVYPWALLASGWEAASNTVLFSARSGDSTNLWRLAVSPDTWKAAGRPERLTFSPATEQAPSAASGPDGSLAIAFSTVSENTDLWSLPVDTATGKVTGDARQLTRTTAADFHPSLSRDGRQMVFVSARSGGQEIWLEDLATGGDLALTASGVDKYHPTISPDGSKVSFAAHHELRWDMSVVPISGGATDVVCADCGQATGWSPDGKYLLGNSVFGRLFLVEVASHRRIDYPRPPGRWMAGGSISPDGRWMTFLDAGRARVEELVPFRGEVAAPEAEWAPIPGEINNWSPDGNFVYGSSTLDGYPCIWGQRVDRVKGTPVGQPIPILHGHTARLELYATVGVGPDRIVFARADRAGNIWLARWKGR